MNSPKIHPFTRRDFLSWVPKGLLFLAVAKWPRLLQGAAPILNDIYWVKGVPDQPFYLGGNSNYHAGVDSLLSLMGKKGLKFYRSGNITTLSGPAGLISANDVVLIKVNAQWKYRGCTNSDVIRGLVQKILDHPDNFSGEVVIFENGQGRGSLKCDTSTSYSGNTEVHANANDETHSFVYLADVIFNDPRVSTFLLDPIRNTFIGVDDHTTNGYRTYENVSYPCFTTAKGNRVELRDGVWKGASYAQNLKLINVPVLKHHDNGGSEITESLKHMYGLVSMSDGQSTFRHYAGLGETCGKMMVSVCPPVLNIIDAIWVSHLALTGYPESNTHRSSQLLASQDPVALDYWAAKFVLYPINSNSRHHPDFSGINAWLTSARDIINTRGGMANAGKGIIVGSVTRNEAEMRVYAQRAALVSKANLIGSWGGAGVLCRNSETGEWTTIATPGECIASGDFDGDGIDDLVGIWPAQGGVWVKSSSSGKWSKLASPARNVSAADMNGDGRSDLLGTWDGDGVYYRDSVKGTWIKMATPASQVVAGDLDRDGKDDLVGIWPEQGGVWVKYSGSSTWAKLATTADSIAVGDMNGDGLVDLVGSWSGLGVFYRDSSTGTWVKIANPATAIATGDLDGDGIDDLIGIWPNQGGVWVRYSKDGSWEKLGTVADFIATGRMAQPTTPLSSGLKSLSTFGLGLEGMGPGLASMDKDLSSGSPGGNNFVFNEEKNLFPHQPARATRIAGPGEAGFRWVEKGSLTPEAPQAPRTPRLRTGKDHHKNKEK